MRTETCLLCSSSVFHRRLLTTHRVQTLAEALAVIAVIAWYRRRWNIEQVFHILKTQGLGIEQSVVADGEALEKLVVIALIVATMTMQLVLAAPRPIMSGEPTIAGGLRALPSRPITA